MFGKFGKKKIDESTEDKKPKQKNDLFTLLESSPEKSIDPRDSLTENFPKKSSTKPEKTSEINSLKSETVSKTNTLKPETISKTDFAKPKTNKRNSLKPNTESNDIESIKSKKSYEIPESSIIGDKSQLLLLEIEKLPDKTIKPVVDFNENCLFYPILSKIGQSPDDILFLDDLAADGTLNKEVFEKLIICPLHPDAFSSSVRLYCPKCNSLNVDKLNLYEHKRCGYITESKEYDFSDPKNSTCPSCKKKIEDFRKEIRVPAMWHQCIDCNEKFDNAIVKLYCRQHEHDFDTNSGQFVTTYSYRLKDYEEPITSDDDKMHEDLKKLLNEFNFSVDFKASVKGKSGNSHKIPIFAKNKSNGEGIAIFINRQSENISQVDINSILIPILDVGPKSILMLTTASVEEDVMPIAKQYGIEIISADLSKIIQHVDEFVSERYSRNGEK
ncbi:MAG: hypothetical protein OEM79_01080 [Nitrosopumilus sp.]|nr:hypothetical protein [Nitrosopumilus sp.]